MADCKRYYWLKLKDDFFLSKRIKKLRILERGDTLVIIYLKLQLIAMKNDGVIVFSGLEPTFAEELALELDEPSADVGNLLEYLLRVGLAEAREGDRYFFPYAVENTGSETGNARRVRRQRERKRAEPLQCNSASAQCNNSGAQCNSKSAQCNTEIEKEIESEIEQELESETETESLTVSEDTVRRMEDIRRVMNCWNTLGLQQLVHLNVSSRRGRMLCARIREYGVETVLEAIEKIRQSPFLRGQNGKNWVITFEWFVRPNNFSKVLEGNFDDRSKASKPARAFVPTEFEEYSAEAPDLRERSGE